ncbi:hypothetical protein JCM10207_007565 [Rhodosporidiobolus poonsookiae]
MPSEEAIQDITQQAYLVLIICQSALFGYCALEAVYYFSRFPKDRLGFKVLVVWLCFLEVTYYAVRLAMMYVMLDTRLDDDPDSETPGPLNLLGVALTTCVEASTEGFYVWRLWRVTKRKWMRGIACCLWLFSTSSHIAWVTLGGIEGRASIVGNPRQLPVVQCAFWGTFAEGIFVATCLLYELQFANDRKAIKHSSNSTVSQLFSLALRTSGILVIFEVIVAVAVSIRSQPSHVIVLEIEFAAGLYTILASIVVLYTLNYRSTLRGAPRSSNTAPRITPTIAATIGGTPALGAPKTPVLDRLGGSVGRVSSRLGRGSGGAGGAAQGAGTGTGSGTGAAERARKPGGRRKSVFDGQISVTQTSVSHVEEFSMADLAQDRSDGDDDEGLLGPSEWVAKGRAAGRPA